MLVFKLQVVLAKGIVKIINKSGHTYFKDEMPTILENYYDHYDECYKQCSLIESSLETLQSATYHSYFPAIIGRRPNVRSNDIQSTEPLIDKENVSVTHSSSIPTIVSLLLV